MDDKGPLDQIARLLSLALQAASGVALVGIGLIVVISIWRAAHERGTVIEAFQVPKELSDHGFTGQVVASKLRDDLQNMEQTSELTDENHIDVQPPDNPTKVTVSEAGVSIEEVSAYLTQWLSSEQEISGELAQQDGRISLTARVRGDSTVPCNAEATSAQLETLIATVSRCLFGKIDPVRFADFLEKDGGGVRAEEALEDFQTIAQGNASVSAKAWAYRELGVIARNAGEFDNAKKDFSEAIRLEPRFALAYSGRLELERDQGDDQSAYQDLAKLVSILRSGNQPEISKITSRLLLGEYEPLQAQMIGDYKTAGELNASAATAAGARSWYIEDRLERETESLAALHEDSHVAQLLGQLADFAQSPTVQSRLEIAENLQDWQLAKCIGEDIWYSRGDQSIYRPCYPVPGSSSHDNGKPDADTVSRAIVEKEGLPTAMRIALAFTIVAHSDQSPSDKELDSRAQSLLSATLNETCYLCFIVRGRIYAFHPELKKNPIDSFTQAIGRGPALPFAYVERGRYFLSIGDAEEALVDFRAAHTLSPNFARASQLLGESLIKLGEIDSARPILCAAASQAPSLPNLLADFKAAQRAGRPTAQERFCRDRLLEPIPSTRQRETWTDERLIECEIKGLDLMEAAKNSDDLKAASSDYSDAQSDFACQGHGRSAPWTLYAGVLGIEEQTETTGAKVPRGGDCKNVDLNTAFCNLLLAVQELRTSPLDQPLGQQDIRFQVTKSLVNVGDAMAQHRMVFGRPDQAAQIWQDIEPYAYRVTRIHTERAEALEFSGKPDDLATSLQEYETAWRVDTGDRAALTAIVIDRANKQAVRDEEAGCFAGANQIYEDVVSDILPWPYTSDKDRILIKANLTELLKAEHRDGEASLYTANTAGLGPEDQTFADAQLQLQRSAIAEGYSKAHCQEAKKTAQN